MNMILHHHAIRYCPHSMPKHAQSSIPSYDLEEINAKFNPTFVISTQLEPPLLKA